MKLSGEPCKTPDVSSDRSSGWNLWLMAKPQTTRDVPKARQIWCSSGSGKRLAKGRSLRLVVWETKFPMTPCSTTSMPTLRRAR